MHSKLITHTRSHLIYPDCGSFLRQKRTWESNKNDIRVCRMKGKHEVQCSCTTTLWLWEVLSHASTLSTPSHAWTDTTAVGETVFPLGAPAYGIYTNSILLIQNQRRLITRAQWNVTRAERCPQKHESRFSCTPALWQFSSYTWFVAFEEEDWKVEELLCVYRVIVDSVLRYEGECDQNCDKNRKEFWWDVSLIGRVYPKILKI